MAIPRKVREQAEKANKILSEKESEAQVNDEDNEPVEEHEVEANVQHGEQTTEHDYSQQKPDEDWKHKYQVIDGKYKHEVPRFQREIKELKEENHRLMEAFRALQQQMQDGQKQSESKQKKSTDVIDSLKDEYPEDLLNTLRTIAGENERLRQEIEGLRNEGVQTKQYSQNVATARYQEALLSRVPDAQDIFQSPEFQEYLNNVEPMSGYTFQQLLQDAANNLDVARTVAIFSGFKRQNTNEDVEQKKAKRTSELERQVSPSRGAQVPLKAEPKNFKVDEISDFYKRAALGKVSRKDFASINETINRALAEGRVSR